MAITDNNLNSTLPWDWKDPAYPTSPSTGTFQIYPHTIYKYQIQCPKCEKFNWLELDKITVCSTEKCRAKLKAVAEKVDFEIEINE